MICKVKQNEKLSLKLEIYALCFCVCRSGLQRTSLEKQHGKGHAMSWQTSLLSVENIVKQEIYLSARPSK